MSLNYQVSSSQASVIADFVNTKRNLFVTGNAGSGKSYVLGILRDIMDNKVKYLVVAKTGIAAINVGGQTIGSVFRVPTDKNKRDIIQFDVLIIDEIGTVSIPMFQMIDEYLRMAKPSNSHLPMGGVRIIAFGDFEQIPPYDLVGSSVQQVENVENSELWKSLDCKYHVLRRSMRNSNPDQKEILTFIREKTENEQVIDYLTKNCMDQSKINDSYVHLFYNDNAAKQFNDQRLKSIDTQLFIYKAEVIDKSYKPENVELKIGARVMCTKNIKDRNISNGSVGVVTSLRRHVATVQFDHLDSFIDINYEPYYVTKIINNKTQSKLVYKHLPLSLAWGITILKSQGLTIEKVALHVTNNMHRGLFYVGVTRVKDLRNLVLIGYKPGTNCFTL